MYVYFWDVDGGFYEIYFEGVFVEIFGFYVCVMGIFLVYDYGYNW